VLVNAAREEGWAQGGIIVQDCLEFLNNLLRNNPGNQLLFRCCQPSLSRASELLFHPLTQLCLASECRPHNWVDCVLQRDGTPPEGAGPSAGPTREVLAGVASTGGRQLAVWT
jgi:hypothetical protein